MPSQCPGDETRIRRGISKEEEKVGSKNDAFLSFPDADVDAAQRTAGWKEREMCAAGCGRTDREADESAGRVRTDPNGGSDSGE